MPAGPAAARRGDRALNVLAERQPERDQQQDHQEKKIQPYST